MSSQAESSVPTDSAIRRAARRSARKARALMRREARRVISDSKFDATESKAAPVPPDSRRAASRRRDHRLAPQPYFLAEEIPAVTEVVRRAGVVDWITIDVWSLVCDFVVAPEHMLLPKKLARLEPRILQSEGEIQPVQQEGKMFHVAHGQVRLEAVCEYEHARSNPFPGMCMPLAGYHITVRVGEVSMPFYLNKDEDRAFDRWAFDPCPGSWAGMKHFSESCRVRDDIIETHRLRSYAVACVSAVPDLCVSVPSWHDCQDIRFVLARFFSQVIRSFKGRAISVIV